MVSWVIVLIEFGNNFSDYGVVTQSGKQLECIKEAAAKQQGGVETRINWRL